MQLSLACETEPPSTMPPELDSQHSHLYTSKHMLKLCTHSPTPLQIGRHTPDHAKSVADTGALATLVSLEGDAAASEDLRTKCRRALKGIIAKLTHLPALDALVHRNLPEGVMKMVLEQVGKVLANDPPGRAQFVHSGGLAAVQQMAEAPGSKLREAVEIINSCYPEEIVKYYSPSYSQQLLEKLEQMSTQQAAY